MTYLYFIHDPENACMTYQGYNHVKAFTAYALEDIMELSKDLDTSIVFVNINHRIYMVRNIVDGNFRPFAVLIMELNVEEMFGGLRSIWGYKEGDIFIDDVSVFGVYEEDPCQKIKDAGYAPIACALGNIPHYWWEFSIFNHTSPATHLQVPESVDSEGGKAWVAGMNDIKELYELGYFPDNTLSATDDETFQMFMDGKAAFLIDGSWKVGGIVAACQSDPEDASTLDTEKLAKFDVTYVPGQGDRKATDLIGGLSMGYYISAKAWEDPDTRAAAVSFVEYMTSDEIVPIFAQHTASALKNAPAVDEAQFNPLQVKSMKMMSGTTSLTGAVQDIFNGDCRVSTFDGMEEHCREKLKFSDMAHFSRVFKKTVGISANEYRNKL